MGNNISKNRVRLLAILLAGSVLSGCNNLERLSRVGSEPQLSQIENPTEKNGYKPVVLPMPAPQPVTRHANSLWRQGARAFFKDQRAQRVGDILTVNIEIAEEASLENETTRTRQSAEDMQANSLLGYQNKITSFIEFLPEGINPADLLNISQTGRNVGTGKIEREEEIKLTVAAVVTQVMPNGNLVIIGTQEIRVNGEVRQISVGGVIRPEDITSTNQIQHTQIAEARISYGGKGIISDAQTPRYGYEILDILMPF